MCDFRFSSFTLPFHDFLHGSEGRHLGSVDQNEEVVESELKYAYALSGIAAGCPEH